MGSGYIGLIIGVLFLIIIVNMFSSLNSLGKVQNLEFINADSSEEEIDVEENKDEIENVENINNEQKSSVVNVPVKSISLDELILKRNLKIEELFNDRFYDIDELFKKYNNVLHTSNKWCKNKMITEINFDHGNTNLENYQDNKIKDFGYKLNYLPCGEIISMECFVELAINDTEPMPKFSKSCFAEIMDAFIGEKQKYEKIDKRINKFFEDMKVEKHSEDEDYEEDCNECTEKEDKLTLVINDMNCELIKTEESLYFKILLEEPIEPYNENISLIEENKIKNNDHMVKKYKISYKKVREFFKNSTFEIRISHVFLGGKYLKKYGELYKLDFKDTACYRAGQIAGFNLDLDIGEEGEIDSIYYSMTVNTDLYKMMEGNFKYEDCIFFEIQNLLFEINKDCSLINSKVNELYEKYPYKDYVAEWVGRVDDEFIADKIVDSEGNVLYEEKMKIWIKLYTNKIVYNLKIVSPYKNRIEESIDLK